MPLACRCTEPHERRRIVLTGGPGAGKTATLELVRQYFCAHVRILPESAGIVFGGGFPRDGALAVRQAAQRAVFFVQRELETAIDSDNPAVSLCDRGTVDGVAYWTGPEDFWVSVGASRMEHLARYDAVIHLRTPSVAEGYNWANPLRTESALEAMVIDARIAEAWTGHPRRYFVEPALDFLTKCRRVLAILRDELPQCCREYAGQRL